MAMITDTDSLIWAVIDIHTAEYREDVDSEQTWQMLTVHQCNSVIQSARIHHTNTRFHVGCGAIAAYAWLRDQGALETAWMQTNEDAGNAVARGASILRIVSFQKTPCFKVGRHPSVPMEVVMVCIVA